jgi:hypothetical protein
VLKERTLRIPGTLLAAGVLTVAVMSSIGCGSKFVVVPAKGRVVCAGNPVTSGSISFSPVGNGKDSEAGKTATATVAPDGTFTLTTNDRFDGAIVGRHRVEYIGSEGGDDGDGGGESTGSDGTGDEVTQDAASGAAKASTSNCAQGGEIIVEVKADGPNDFTIELTPGGAAAAKPSEEGESPEGE